MNTELHEDEARRVILAMTEQACRDWLAWKRRGIRASDKGDSWRLNEAQQARKTAEAFLFSDSYRVQWGELEVSPEELLLEAGVDIDWLRRRLLQRLSEAQKTDC